MSELNISEKIADSFVTVLKKTKLFEKLDRIQFYMGTFVLLTSVTGIIGMAIHYTNAAKIYENSKIQQNNKMEITDKISDINKLDLHNEHILKQLTNKITDLEHKIIKLTNIQENHLSEIKKQNNMSSNSSLSSLTTNSPLAISCSQIHTYHQINNQEEAHKLQERDLKVGYFNIKT